jgi:hypothetical protein
VATERAIRQRWLLLLDFSRVYTAKLVAFSAIQGLGPSVKDDRMNVDMEL